MQSCNLTTQNVLAHVVYEKDLDTYYYNWDDAEDTIRLITRIGCRQTLASQWHPIWNATQKRDRLLGVSMTGLVDALDLLRWDDKELEYFLTWSKSIALDEADKYHDYLGINHSTRITLMKPEGCEVIETLRTFKEGILRIDEINPNIINISGFIDNDLKLNTTGTNDNVSKLYNNGLSEIVEITLNNGRKIKSTHKHQFSVNGNWVSAIDLQIKDILDFELDTYNNLNNSKLIQLEKLTGLRDITIPIEMSEQLSWFIAALYANGSTSKRGYIDFCSGYQDVCSKYQNIVKLIFNLDITFKKDKNKNMYKSRIGSTDLWDFLDVNSCLKSKHFDRVPLVIRKSSKNTILSFITGYLDTDGCFKNKGCCITSTKLLFARNLQETSEAIGLSFSAYETIRETTKGICHYIDLQLSRVFSTKESIDYINQNSIKAKTKPIIKAYKSHKNPYMIKSVVALDTLEYTYDVEVENSHWYYNGGIKSHNTVSKLPGVSSGVHRSYAPYFYQRIRFSKTDPLATVLVNLGLQPVPENGQGNDLFGEQCNTWVFTFGIKTNTPIRAIDEPALVQLERYRLAQVNYADRGHNVSATITLAPHEYDIAANWINDNWNDIIGVSFLPRFDPSEGGQAAYPNMPWEPCTEEQYNTVKQNIPVLTEEQLITLLSHIEIKYEEDIIEDACATGMCPLR